MTCQPDRFGAWSYSMAAGSVVISPEAQSHAGQYWFVVGGELLDGGRLLPSTTHGCGAHDAVREDVQAGPRGVRLLDLQFAQSA
jgi:hypothetical protein